MSKQPVDLVQLARNTLGDNDLEREVLALFIRQANNYFDRIRGAEKLCERKEAAHTIYGSACGVGAWNVAKAASAVEKSRGKDCSKQLAALDDAIHEADAFIRPLLVAH